MSGCSGLVAIPKEKRRESRHWRDGTHATRDLA